MNIFSFKSVLLMFALIVLSSTSWAAPKAELWPFWQQDNAANITKISHTRWQQFLTRYVVVKPSQTLVRYSAVTPTDKENLDRYLRDMARIDPRDYNKKEQFAYWVNLYNALTVQLILNNYPIASITKLGGLFSFGPWDDDRITVDGKKLTLNDIEHRILRPIWRDKRIHYAVNCASLGCPNLLPITYTAANQETLLEQASREFINSDKAVLSQGKKVRLSSIYDWYASDFGTQIQLQNHLNRYLSSAPVSLNNNVMYDYDWTLNQAR